jgi:hypothetical protein
MRKMLKIELIPFDTVLYKSNVSRKATTCHKAKHYFTLVETSGINCFYFIRFIDRKGGRFLNETILTRLDVLILILDVFILILHVLKLNIVGINKGPWTYEMHILQILLN